MNVSHSDLLVENSDSSSLDAVEDSLDRQYHHGPRQDQQAYQYSQWQAPELRRSPQQLFARPTRMMQPGLSHPVGVSESRSGTHADPFESGSFPNQDNHLIQPPAAASSSRGSAFRTPDTLSTSGVQQQQYGPPFALHRFHPHRQNPHSASNSMSSNGSPLPPGHLAGAFETPILYSSAGVTSSGTQHQASTPQAAMHTLAGAVTPINTYGSEVQSRQEQQRGNERQYRPMPPPPPAPTRPSRQAPDMAQQPPSAAPSLWRAAPVQSRLSDAFASPASSSFSAEFGVNVPSFHLSAMNTVPTVPSHRPQQPNSNLDAAALAAERRIRDVRQASANVFNTPAALMQPQQQYQLQRHQYEQQPYAQQSREQQLRTPSELGMGVPSSRMLAFVQQQPDPHSILGTNASSQHGALSLNQSRAVVAPSVVYPGQGDISISMSSFGSLPALPAHTTGARTRKEAVQDHSIASYATSTFDDQTSASNPELAIAPAPVNTAQFQKWDGSIMTVPTWVVASSSAEDEVEEWFESDAVDRFDVQAITARTRSGTTSQLNLDDNFTNQDVLKAILETQLGLHTGLGWYGYTYRNPKPSKRGKALPTHSSLKEEDGATGIEEAVVHETDTDAVMEVVSGTRKRRRISSSPSSVAENSGSVQIKRENKDAQPVSPPHSADDDDNDNEEVSDTENEAVDLIYDAFGRVRGTVPRMGYSSRGGPKAPLPPPLETASLRTACARDAVLQSYVHRSKHEARLLADLRLVHSQYEALHNRSQSVAHNSAPPQQSTIKSHAFYEQLKVKHRNLAHYRAKNRPSLLKGLQNAVFSSTVPSPYPSAPLWHD